MTAIVTDSTACLPADLVERYQIEVVPLHIIFAGRTFVDSMADTAEFYALLRSSGERPTTAASSPGMFLQAIERAARRSDSVLCITVSKQFSALYDSARQAMKIAKAESPSLDARVLDSRNAAMAQGFVALEAARLAVEGAAMDAVVARADEMTRRVALIAMLDTLAYLARSGRVPRVAAWAAGALQVKPVVRFSASDIRLVARARTRTRGLQRLTDLLVESVAGRRVHLAVHHANAPESAEQLREAAQARLNVAELYTTEFTQVMGVHTGPGLAGYAYWCE